MLIMVHCRATEKLAAPDIIQNPAAQEKLKDLIKTKKKEIEEHPQSMQSSASRPGKMNGSH